MADAPRVLYLIDISSYFYRAFHAIRGLGTSEGLPTNAAYGVTTMLLKVLQGAPAPLSRPGLRQQGAHPAPPGLSRIQGPPAPACRKSWSCSSLISRRSSTASGCRPCSQEGFEADDLICTLVHRARAQGFQVEIISGDKDLLPLVQEGVDDVGSHEGGALRPGGHPGASTASPRRNWSRCGPWPGTPATISPGCRVSVRRPP